MAGFGKLDWSNWLYGLFSGLIGGGATSVGTGIANIVVDPNDFNIYAGLHKLLLVMVVSFVVGALTAFFAFLKTQPLPPIIHTETNVQKTESTPEGVQTVTTMQKTQTVTAPPADSPKP